MERIDELLGERSPFPLLLRFPEEMGLKTPLLDVYEEGDTIVVKAELPGMKKGEIDIRVAGEMITISGTKEKEEKVERKEYFRLERSAGSFTRSVKLPAQIDSEKVSATYRDGVLEIHAPKAEPAKPAGRKIEIG
jgi:HSP20 family protein